MKTLESVKDVIFVSGGLVLVEGLDGREVAYAQCVAVNSEKVIQVLLKSGEILFFCHKSGNNGDSVFELTSSISFSFNKSRNRLVLSMSSNDVVL